jgi:uncharacterized membrane protein/osmotically-inducible protein OsmY
MNKGLVFLSGVGVGGALIYMLDPDRGTRRRALLRDQLVHVTHKTPDAISATARDLRNRVRGVAAELSHAFTSDEVSDEVLVARVRSQMGRVVSHPHAIEVKADRGRVTLSGPILSHEVGEWLSCASAVRGVKELENHLEVHKQAGDLPSLQAGKLRPGNRFEFLQENLSPTARLLISATGAALTVHAVRRKDPPGAGFLGIIGLGLIARGVTNLGLARLPGAGTRRHSFEVQKTIDIAAPVDQVFRFWTNHENFPRFMTHVREVIDTGNNRSHWVAGGAAEGLPVEWDAVITKSVPNKLLAWENVEGAALETSGTVGFRTNVNGSTRVQVRFSCNASARAREHAATALFGRRPNRQLDQDLMRMKSLIESSNRPEDAAESSSQVKRAHASH